MTDQAKQTADGLVMGNIGCSRTRLESELQALGQRAIEIRQYDLGGGRELALAITNIEQGLLWLEKAAQKL